MSVMMIRGVEQECALLRNQVLALSEHRRGAVQTATRTYAKAEAPRI